MTRVVLCSGEYGTGKREKQAMKNNREKKPSDVKVLLGYAGSYRKLTYLGLVLSAVAMILGMAPYLCIWLDEATASLDVENETKVQGALSRLLAGKTVLVIAHRMRTVEAADRIVVLADGRVAETGTPEELLKKENGIFRRMAQLQASSAEWSI